MNLYREKVSYNSDIGKMLRTNIVTKYINIDPKTKKMLMNEWSELIFNIFKFEITILIP